MDLRLLCLYNHNKHHYMRQLLILIIIVIITASIIIILLHKIIHSCLIFLFFFSSTFWHPRERRGRRRRKNPKAIPSVCLHIRRERLSVSASGQATVSKAHKGSFFMNTHTLSLCHIYSVQFLSLNFTIMIFFLLYLLFELLGLIWNWVSSYSLLWKLLVVDLTRLLGVSDAACTWGMCILNPIITVESLLLFVFFIAINLYAFMGIIFSSSLYLLTIMWCDDDLDNCSFFFSLDI